MPRPSKEILDAIESEEYDNAAMMLKSYSPRVIRRALKYAWTCGKETGEFAAGKTDTHEKV